MANTIPGGAYIPLDVQNQYRAALKIMEQHRRAEAARIKALAPSPIQLEPAVALRVKFAAAFATSKPRKRKRNRGKNHLRLL